ncbi:MAG: DEAD/DEAH box helicase [Rectinemataceae bacterium]
MTFDTFGLSAQMLEALAKKGFEEATSIQALAIPKLMVPGKALAARARTGTGKTAAFGIPLVEALRAPAEGEWVRGQVRALILVPTRELALQVAEEISSLRSGDRPRMACVYGGAPMVEQLRRLASGVDIVVGTPGRVLDHLKRGSLDISRIGHFVLDEADEMLDMGFIEDIEAVMGMMNESTRVVLFSATLAAPVLRAVRDRVGEIEIVEDCTDTLPTELAEQLWIEVREKDRLEALCRLIDASEEFYAIVFVSTKVESDRVAKSLEERGYDAEALNGDMGQEARERVLAKFRDHRVAVLVATDVAARGIDIEKLTHVINWSLPHDADSYLHRIGRTGRAGNTGTAITFVTPEEYRKLFRLRQVSGKALKKGAVPAVDGLIAAKKERLLTRLEAKAAESGESSGVSDAVFGATAGATTDIASGAAAGPAGKAANPWFAMADELLTRMDARDALAATLSEGFGSLLDRGKYREIEEISVDDSGVTRLFVGAGKRDRLDARALVTFVKRHSGLPDNLIGSVELYDSFSFVSVPYKAAQKIIDSTRSAGAFPKVRLATPRGGAPGPQGSQGAPRFREGGPGAPAPRRNYGPQDRPRRYADNRSSDGNYANKGTPRFPKKSKGF